MLLEIAHSIPHVEEIKAGTRPTVATLKDARELAMAIKDENLTDLVYSVLDNNFGVQREKYNAFFIAKSDIDAQGLVFQKDNYNVERRSAMSELGLRSGKSLGIEKTIDGGETWRLVESEQELIKHIQARLNLTKTLNEDTTNYLTTYTENTSKDLLSVKDEYVRHQLEILDVENIDSAEAELKKHTSIDFEGKIKFLKLNGKGKPFHYKTKSNKSFREDVKTVLDTHERVKLEEKKISSELISFFGGAGIVLLNHFVTHGDPNALKSFAIFGSLVSYLTVHGASAAENRFIEGTKIGDMVRKIKKVASSAFYLTAGMASAEIAIDALSGDVYNSHSPDTHSNMTSHYHGHQPATENQSLGGDTVTNQGNAPEIPTQVPEKHTIEDLMQLDPKTTTESELREQVKEVVSGDNWINNENGVSKVDVITQQIEKFWGHNQSGPLTRNEMETINMIDKTKTYDGFLRARDWINGWVRFFVE